MDSLCLAAVADDLARRLTGRRLGAAVVPRREQLFLGTPDGALLISIEPARPRVHLVAALPAAPRPEPSIQTHLDSLLRTAEVVSVRTVNLDRVLHMAVHGLDRVGNERDYTLVVELMGKHSACVVLDQDGLIVATLKTVTRAVNRHRELLARLPYTPPPDGGRRDPLALTPDDWALLWPELSANPDRRAGWRAVLFGMSDELYTWLAARGLDGDRDEAWQAVVQLQDVVRSGAWRPHIRRGPDGQIAEVWPLELPGWEPVADLNTSLAQIASRASGNTALAERRAELRGIANRALHRVESRLKGVDRATDRAAQADRWQHEADLLLSNLHRIGPRASEVEVEDWAADGQPVRIELDSRLNGSANANALYERAQRARRAVQETPGNREDLAAQVARLRELQLTLGSAPDLDALDALADAHEDVLADGQTSLPSAVDKPRTERDRWLRRLERRTSADGYTILIGRNSADSEGLLSRVAAPSDLWFHVRGAGSGHVIIRTNGKPDAVPQRTLEEAARWAARCSKMKHSSLVPVVYTQRKYVTKVTGGAAGKVVYRHEKSLYIEP